MGGTTAVMDLLRQRRVLRSRCADPASVRATPIEPHGEGVIYLTPSGEGYVLYASRSTAPDAAGR